MNQNAVQLMFLRMSLANAYDQQDWDTVHEMCRRIDELALERARRSQTLDEDAI